MKVIQRQAISVAGLAAVAVLGLSACSGDTSTSATAEPASSTIAATSAAPKPMDQPVDPGANLVGPGCADYAAQNPTGPASVTGMAQDPVVSSGLLDAAFAKIDPATIEKLKTDSNLLSSILTYHVVPGQASPAQVTGMHKTVQGGEVNVTGMGTSLKVNNAGVVCGGVRTANATVYLIDTVLMPPAA